MYSQGGFCCAVSSFSSSVIVRFPLRKRNQRRPQASGKCGPHAHFSHTKIRGFAIQYSAMVLHGKTGWAERLDSGRRKRLLSILARILLIILTVWGILVALLPANVWLAVEPAPGTHPSVPWVFRVTHPLGVLYLLWVTWEDARQNPALPELLLALAFVLAGLLGVIVLWKVPQWQARFSPLGSQRMVQQTAIGDKSLHRHFVLLTAADQRE